MDVPRVDTRLEAVGGIVDSGDRFVERVVGVDAHYRPKCLAAGDFRARGNVRQHRRRNGGPRPRAAAHKLRPGFDGLADPALHPLGLAFGDQRADVGVRRVRMPHVELARSFDKALHKFIADLRVDVNPLHRNTHLAGVREAPRDAARHRLIKIRIILHNHSRIRPQLQGDPLHTGQIADAHPHVHAAGERHHGDALVEHQHVADRAARPGDHVERARRQSALRKNAGHQDGGYRRGRRGLVNHGIAARQRRSDLMHSQIQRKVEGSDRRDHAQRLTNRHRPVPLAARSSVHGDHFPTQPVRLFGREQQRHRRAFHLQPRLFDRLARFRADRHRHLIAAFEQSLISLAQNGRALVERHFAHDRRSRYCRRNSRVNLFLSRLINGADLGPIVGQLHRASLGALHRLPADVHRVLHAFMIGQEAAAACSSRAHTPSKLTMNDST